MRRVMVLGNCVATRLQDMLAAHEALRDLWQVVPAPLIHSLTEGEQTNALAQEALACQCIFTQPLFRYGACNTAALQAALHPGHRCITFSAPNFEAYFPDVLHAPPLEDARFSPPLEWHSRIFFQCWLTGISLFDVETCYLNHPLFRPDATRKALDAAWRTYTVREQGVEIGTLERVRRDFAKEALFHTWNHPADNLVQLLLEGMLEALGVEMEMEMGMELEGFGFNQWPIITRHHGLFRFAERAYFRVGNERISIEDAAAAYYTFYDFHKNFAERMRPLLTR